MRHYLVRDIMSQPAITIAWGESILEAAALMEANNIRRLPVVDDENVVIGIISLGDVREATSVYSTANPYAPDHDEALLAVDEVMSSPVLTLRPEENLKRAVEMMLQRKIGGVPVVDAAGHALGMVTDSDVFRLLLTNLEEDGASGSSV